MPRLILICILFAASLESRAFAICTSNADCKGGRVCSAGECVEPCAQDSDCAQGQVCAERACVAGCTRDKDCPGDQICQRSRCLDCVADADCKNGGTCAGGRCIAHCIRDKDCPGDLICVAGACVASTGAAAPAAPPTATVSPPPAPPVPSPAPVPVAATPPAPVPVAAPPPAPRAIPSAVVQAPSRAEPPGMSARRKGGIAFDVIGLVVAGAGAVSWGLSASQFNSANSAVTVGERDSTWKAAWSAQAAGISLVSIGGLALATGALMTFIPESKPEKAVWLAPTGNGCAIGGTF